LLILGLNIQFKEQLIFTNTRNELKRLPKHSYLHKNSILGLERFKTQETNNNMSHTAMTPDQFFDELDKLFGTDDGYENHLKRIKGLKEQNEELKASEQSTMNYWQSKYEFEKDALSKIQDERDMYFRDITRIIPELESLKKQTAELKKEGDWIQSDLEDEQEEHEWTKHDLEKLQGDLEPLDEMMDKIKEVNEYKDVVDYVNGLHQKNLELQEKFENEESTNKMLNDAIISHTEILDELRQYLSLFDGDEVEVFDKIVKGSTD